MSAMVTSSQDYGFVTSHHSWHVRQFPKLMDCNFKIQRNLSESVTLALKWFSPIIRWAHS